MKYNRNTLIAIAFSILSLHGLIKNDKQDTRYNVRLVT